jgi:flagellar basal body-associated protein FliL
MQRNTSNAPSSMDKRILYILAGVIAVLIIVVGVEIGIDASMTTGIDLGLSTTTPNAK